jgi:hypothetical protein
LTAMFKFIFGFKYFVCNSIFHIFVFLQISTKLIQKIRHIQHDNYLDHKEFIVKFQSYCVLKKSKKNPPQFLINAPHFKSTLLCNINLVCYIISPLLTTSSTSYCTLHLNSWGWSLSYSFSQVASLSGWCFPKSYST